MFYLNLIYQTIFVPGHPAIKAGKKHQAECPFCYDPDHFAYESAGPNKDYGSVRNATSGNAITLTAKLLNMSNGSGAANKNILELRTRRGRKGREDDFKTAKGWKVKN